MTLLKHIQVLLALFMLWHLAFPVWYLAFQLRNFRIGLMDSMPRAGNNVALDDYRLIYAYEGQ